MDYDTKRVRINHIRQIKHQEIISNFQIRNNSSTENKSDTHDEVIAEMDAYFACSYQIFGDDTKKEKHWTNCIDPKGDNGEK